MKKYTVIDVGGTAIKYALLSQDGEILDKGETPTDVKDVDSYADLLVSLFEKYGDQAEGLAMSAPGKIDSVQGYFHTGGALKFMNGVNLKDEIWKRKEIPFCCANDAKCAAAAEVWKGSMQGVRNGAVLTLGTGIGGALILNGKMYEGSTFSAGEFSTIPLHWNAKYDRHACWYQQQGVGYLSRRYAEATGADPASVNGRVLFADVLAGKEEACKALKNYCDSLAAGLYGLQAILDLEKIAVGGGISRQEILLETLRESMQETFAEAHGYPASMPEVTACTFSSDANLVGALYYYLQQNQ